MHFVLVYSHAQRVTPYNSGTGNYDNCMGVGEQHSATVRQVHETLLECRSIAYTTVMTMMNILEQKRYLTKTPGNQ